MMFRERGAALLLTFLMMLVLAGLVAAVGFYANATLVGSRSQYLDRSALYIAEAGWQRARQAISADTWAAAISPGNTYTESFGSGEYAVTIVASNACSSSCTYTVTSAAYIPTQAAAIARRQLEEGSVTATVTVGSNYSLTATASASSSNGGNTPGNAKDSNTGTHWQAGVNGTGTWLAMDYGSAVTLDRIVVREEANISNLTIEYSDNGSTWTAPSGLAVSNSGTTWTTNFSSTSHRYFRAYFTGVPSNRKAAVDEFESYNIAVTLGTGEVTTEW